MNPFRRASHKGAAWRLNRPSPDAKQANEKTFGGRRLIVLICCLALGAGLGGWRALGAAGHGPWQALRKAATLPISPAMPPADGPVCTNFTTRLGSSQIFGVHAAGSTIYAATYGSGLAISTDGGTSFTTRTTANGLADDFLTGVYAQGSTVYVAAGNPFSNGGGLSISTDGGATFTNRTSANGLGNDYVNGVYAQGTTVYAATAGGLSISTNGGASFINRTSANGLGNDQVSGVFAVGSTVYAATFTGGLSISTDGGASFTNRTTADGLGSNFVQAVYAEGSKVYAATSSGLSISTDGGASFTTRTTANGLSYNFVQGVYAIGNTVYAATQIGLSISTDGGTSFTSYTTANGLGNNGVRGVFATAASIYAATDAGLSFCPPPAPAMAVKGNNVTIANGDTTPAIADGTDLGSAVVNTSANANTFAIANTGAAALNLTGTPKVALSGANAADFSVAVQPTSPVAAGGTTTFLVNFAPTGTGTRNATISIANDDPTKNPYTFAIQGMGTPAPASGPACSNFTNRTTDNGLADNLVTCVLAVGNTIYAGTDFGLLISTDGGATFTTRTTANGLGHDSVTDIFVAGSTVYAATFGGGLAISTDGGATFTTRTTANGLGKNNVYDVYVVGNTVYAGTLIGGLSISTDGGATFTTRTTANGLGNNNVYGVHVVGSTVYAATDLGLSISTDGGANFTTRTTANGLGDNAVRGVYAAGNTVYAATFNFLAGSGGVSISTDGGASFTNRTIANGLGSNPVIHVYALGSTVYAATRGGLSISTDGGANFTNYTTANGLGDNHVSGVFATATAIYAATDGGLSFCPPPNTNPTIMAGGTFTRQQGSASGAAVQIATVNDTETAAGSLTVTATTVPAGITVGAITNTSGTISATLAAGCNATVGNNTVTLTVSDGSLTMTATFTVNVTANDSPTVGTYANQSLAPGGGVTVTPTVAPADNGSIISVTASASPNTFTGSFSGNTATGAVTITNAAPAGNYTVTVTVTDNCSVAVQRTFTLTVDGAPTLTPIPLGIAQGTTTAVMTNVATIGDGETAPSNLTFQISSNGTTFGSSATLNGVAVSLILPPASNGVVKANVTTTCAATTATFTLKVTDALGQMTTAPWTVTITSNTPPTLSYGNQSFPAGGTPSFNPSAGPSDNGSVANIALQSITPATGLSLSVNSTTGQVTVNSATIAQSYTVVIRATDDCGQTADASFTVTLPCPTVALAPTSLPNATVNTAYNQSLTATPAGGNYTFAVSNGLLPTGLTLNSNGSFSGAPTQGGTFNFRVTATGFGNCSAFQDYTLLVNCPSISITTTSLPGGTLGTAYNQTLAVSPAGSYSFAVTSGALPTGLTLNATTGAITGTPNTTGSFAFTVTASSSGCTASKSFTVAIACAGISLSPATLPGGQAGIAYSQTITVSPAGSYSFSIVQGNLPAGLTLNLQTGLITGTPSVSGTSTFIIKAATANGCESTATYTLTVSCPTVTISPANLPNGQRGTVYSQTLSASPAGGNYVFTVSGGSLPNGLTLNSSTGILSGTPTNNGSSTFTVTATGFGGCAGSRQYTVNIGNGNCPTVSLPNNLPGGGVGQLYSNSVAATPTGTYTYTSSGNLPPGVTLFASFGLLYGFPTTNGTYAFTITATDAGGCTGSQSYSVIIGAGSATAINDFSGDRQSDFVLRRATEAQWLILDSASNAAQTIQWGQAGDRAVPGDFDGDGKADFAGFGKDGHWRIKLSNGGTLDKLWGLGSDTPVSGDFDGDGKADLAVWRGAETNWYILRSSDGRTQTVSWGASYAPYFDIPVPGDYDGDGKTDIAVFRQASGKEGGHWYIRQSSDGTVLDKAWGLGTDVPVAADYDGDGKTDIAVWRGSEGVWYVIQSSDGALKSKFWGAAYAPYFDVPATGDYDGDGKTDFAVWRQSDNRWYILQSSDGATRAVAQGKSGDQPVSALPRN